MYGNLSEREISHLELAVRITLQHPNELGQKRIMLEWIGKIISEAFANDRLDDLRLWTVFCRVFFMPEIYPVKLSEDVKNFLQFELELASDTPDEYFKVSDLCSY